MEFRDFQKIPRLSREMVVTEKIDGTNAQILLYSTHDSYNGEFLPYILHQYPAHNEFGDRLVLMAGSRTRWIKPGKDSDNAGFAGWVKDHAKELLALGEGRHFGEWWGRGIQRNYGLTEKRFSLFNVGMWTSEANRNSDPRDSSVCDQVSCCHVVPHISTAPFSTNHIETLLGILEISGSYASPGFMNPEGLVIFHTASGYLFKKTIEKDSLPKSLA